jgi:hypothetical protein
VPVGQGRRNLCNARVQAHLATPGCPLSHGLIVMAKCQQGISQDKQQCSCKQGRSSGSAVTCACWRHRQLAAAWFNALRVGGCHQRTAARQRGKSHALVAEAGGAEWGSSKAGGRGHM